MINEYRRKQVESGIVSNYKKNKTKFDELMLFIDQQFVLQNFEMYRKNDIYFTVQDSLFSMNMNDSIGRDLWHLAGGVDIGEWGDNSIKGFSINNNVLYLNYRDEYINIPDTVIEVRNWRINYRGSVTHPDVKRLLKYNRQSFDKLLELIEILRLLNCEAIYVDRLGIELRYAGHWTESYSYFISSSDTAIFPLDTTDINTIVQLEDGTWWFYQRSPMFCGTTYW